MNLNKKILLGLTTTPGSDWRGKVKETEKLNIDEVALFPTFLKIKERRELYQLIKDSRINSIPHVHIRDDFEMDEIEFFYNNYNTRLFNIHSDEKGERILKKFEKYKDYFYVENQKNLDERFFQMIKKCGGICLDCSHHVQYWKINRQPSYAEFEKTLEEFKIGCCHISAVREKSTLDHNGKNSAPCALHFLSELSELDYVKDYIKYLPETISIELENTFEEQLRVREYLSTIISCNHTDQDTDLDTDVEKV